MPPTASYAIIQQLRKIFATTWSSIVHNNGTCFTSSEFQFLSQNGIHHITAALYHPEKNGLAERAVEEGIKKTTTGEIETNISQFLFITSHTTTGISPAELLLKCKLKSMDLLKTNIAVRALINQTQQKSGHDMQTRDRQFNIVDPVFVHNFAVSGNT